jgi:DNA-binding NtrC family response regulator
MRTALQRVLKTRFSVELADGVRSALERLRSGPQDVDLVLCDMMMPDGGGEQLHAELERLAPRLAARMVFLTGGATTDASRAFLEEHAARVLYKPLDLAALSAKVEQMRGASPRVGNVS